MPRKSRKKSPASPSSESSRSSSRGSASRKHRPRSDSHRSSSRRARDFDEDDRSRPPISKALMRSLDGANRTGWGGVMDMFGNMSETVDDIGDATEQAYGAVMDASKEFNKLMQIPSYILLKQFESRTGHKSLWTMATLRKAEQDFYSEVYNWFDD